MPIRKIHGSWWADIRWHGVRYRMKSPEDTRQGAMVYEMTLRRQLAEGQEIEYRKRGPRIIHRRGNNIMATNAIVKEFQKRAKEVERLAVRIEKSQTRLNAMEERFRSITGLSASTKQNSLKSDSVAHRPYAKRRSSGIMAMRRAKIEEERAAIVMAIRRYPSGVSKDVIYNVIKNQTGVKFSRASLGCYLAKMKKRGEAQTDGTMWRLIECLSPRYEEIQDLRPSGFEQKVVA